MRPLLAHVRDHVGDRPERDRDVQAESPPRARRRAASRPARPATGRARPSTRCRPPPSRTRGRAARRPSPTCTFDDLDADQRRRQLAQRRPRAARERLQVGRSQRTRLAPADDAVVGLHPHHRARQRRDRPAARHHVLAVRVAQLVAEDVDAARSSRPGARVRSGACVAAADLLEARQMQALSLAVHIPIVCFGIAFPAMFLFVEGLYLRTGDTDLQGAREALVEGGADPVRGRRRDRHDPVVRVRTAVAGVHGPLRRGVRDRVRARGDLVLRRGDLHGDLRLRLGPALRTAAHFLTGVPIVLTGFTGSFNVIAVNGWMNDPTGLRRRRRPGRQPAPVGGAAQHQHVARADPHVPGRLHRRRLPRRRDLRARAGCAAGATTTTAPALVVTLAFAALARAGAGDRRRLGGPRGGRAPAGQARRVRGPATQTQEGAPFTFGGFYDEERQRGPLRVRGAEAALAARLPRPERERRQGLEIVPPEDRPPVNIVRYSVPDDGRDRHGPRAARRALPVHVVAEAARCPRSQVVLPRGDGRRPAVVRRADLRLDRRPRSAASRGSSTR